MKIKRNTIIEIEGEGGFLILGRTSFMRRDYYMAWQVDEKGNCLEDAGAILYEDREEFDFEGGEQMDVEDLHFVKDDNLSKLLWEIFSEQIRA